MRAREFIIESNNIASAEQVWNYVGGIHPKDQQGGGFLKSLVMLNPQYELKRIPLSSLHIPDNPKDEVNDPYGRAMSVDVDHAREYSQHYIDKKPLVVDSQGHILDGAHRAWAAAELLNKTDIMAWVPVKSRSATPQDLELRKKFTGQGVAEDQLNELANSSLKVTEPKGMHRVNDRKQTIYKLFKFKSDENTFLITFSVGAHVKGKTPNWNAMKVTFGIREKQDNYGFGDEMNTDLTAKNKNQFLIYSTVINTIRKFITNYNTEIDQIFMMGAGERQEAMYQRFFQSASKYFPGWHFDGNRSLVRDVPRQKVKKVRGQGVAEGTSPKLSAAPIKIGSIYRMKVNGTQTYGKVASINDDRGTVRLRRLNKDGSPYEGAGPDKDSDGRWIQQYHFHVTTPDNLGKRFQMDNMYGELVPYGTAKIPGTEPIGEDKRPEETSPKLSVSKADVVSKQGVAESLDQPYSIDWEDNPNDDSWRRNPDYPTEVYAHATLVDGTPLHIFFVKLNIEDLRDNGDWDIEFSRNNNHEVTGEGDEKRIFATVLVAIQQFVKKYKPNSITFSADTRPPPGPAGTRVNPQSRAKLYNTMVQRYASPAGYRFQRRQGHDKITYLLQRATSGVVEGQLNEFDHESR
jgi:hypothetical protein